MPIIAPKQRVDAPAASPLTGGLFSQFSPIEDSSVRWENGVTWEDVERAQLGAIGQWQRPGTVPGLPKTLTDPKGIALESQAPLTVYAAFRTTPMDHSAAEATSIAGRRLLLQEEHAVEAALWSGAPNRGLGLAKVRSYTPKSGKLSPAQAVAVLEHYAAQYGFQPTLHVPRRLGSLLASEKLIKDARGGGFITRLGTPVVVGAGYADEMQIVATGPLVIYRGEAFTSTSQGAGGFNASQNELTGVAERQYVLGFNKWDAFRVTVDAGLPALDLKAAEE